MRLMPRVLLNYLATAILSACAFSAWVIWHLGSNWAAVIEPFDTVVGVNPHFFDFWRAVNRYDLTCGPREACVMLAEIACPAAEWSLVSSAAPPGEWPTQLTIDCRAGLDRTEWIDQDGGT